MISFIALILAAAPVNTGNTGSIASTNASYDGAMLVLDGEVSLEHGFGMMKAEKAVLTREVQGKEEFPFSCIELADSVRLALTTEAKVECERASLDFSTMKGFLTSPNNVHYVDIINSTPFELFSPLLNLQLMKNGQRKDSYTIQEAHAQKGVHLIYDKLFHLKTESIFLTKETLHSDAGPCVWTHGNDRVDAEKFNLDLASNHLHLQKAHGHLSSFVKGEVQFTADTLDWKHTENYLVLKGSPVVKESSLGTLSSVQEIHVALKDQKVSALKTEGATQLVSHKGHTLKTDGTVNVENGIAKINAGKAQLLYQEDEMTLTADEAVMHYTDEMQPERLELQGHIKVFSQDRRGICDSLSYNPEDRTAILKALPGQKVLFTRDQDNLRISANELHITYDPVTKEQQVRGVGQITLSLSPEEQKLLNQVFSP